MMALKTITMSYFIFILFGTVASLKDGNREEKPAWAKKDIRDYNDADLEHLLDQWEVRRVRFIMLILISTTCFRVHKLKDELILIVN